MSNFDDELLENGVSKFEVDHFNSKKVALFRTMMPSSISASQATPNFFADQQFMSNLYEGTIVNILKNDSYARPNDRTIRMQVTIAKVYNLTTMVQVNEIKPQHLQQIQQLIGNNPSDQNTNLVNSKK